MISRYVLGEFLFAFAAAFCFFFFVLFVNVLLYNAEQIFANQVPIGEVARLMLFALPLIISLAVPFGTLLGALMAVSRLSTDNEIVAIMSVGIPLRRLALPLTAAGIVLTAVSFFAQDVLLPAGTLELNRTLRRILATNPSFEIEPFAVQRYEEMAIVTGSIEGNAIDAPLIMDRTAGGDPRVILADSASIEQSAAGDGVVSLRLRGVVAHVPQDEERHTLVRADSMDYNILLRDLSPSLSAGGPREMTSVDLWRELQVMRERLRTEGPRRAERRTADRYRLLAEVTLAERTVGADAGRLDDERDRLGVIAARFESAERRSASERDLHVVLTELHKRFALPLACVAFVGLALPGGLLARRSGRTFGFLVGICVCFLYWMLLYFGETGALRGGIAPAVPIWLPNVLVLAAAGVIALVIRAR